LSSGLDGKVTLVTGAASGIGRATALAFADEGARLAIADVSLEGLRQTAELLRAKKVDVIFDQVNITDGQQFQGFVGRAVAQFGRLDCAANVAGVTGTVALLADVDEADLRRTLEINVIGTWVCMQAEIKAMLASGGGAIVNVASCAGIRGFSRIAPYTASKHAVIGLTRAGALDYARLNIRINAVCPGFTLTAMIAQSGDRSNIEAAAAANPSGRVARPEEQANTIVYLCSDKASFLTGQAIAVDGGQTTQPAQPPRRDPVK
jgi:NAD(P)-dependent dehydrogenase (short-subunit alcohol dehydrogenase family)